MSEPTAPAPHPLHCDHREIVDGCEACAATVHEYRERSERDASAEGVAAGLEDARATLAEIWRRTDGDAARARAMRALQAVLCAERTMRAADAFVLAAGQRDRAKAYETLRTSCILRVGHGARQRP